MLQPRGDLDLALEPVDVDAGSQLGRQDCTTTLRPSEVSSATKTRDIPPPPSSRSIA